MEHELREVIEGPGLAARCTCGWESARAQSLVHAERRWQIHANQQRAADLCQHAGTVVTTTRQRTLELSAVRQAARERRLELVRRRLDLRVARDRAASAKRFHVSCIERTLECARQLSGLSTEDLWLTYFAYGGTLSLDGLQAVLQGAQAVTRMDYEVLSTVLNEEFREAGFGTPLAFEYRK